jgi:hypothetical protein
MAKKLCVACGRAFTPRPQIRNQSFSSVPEYLRERHRQWQKRKRQLDAYAPLFLADGLSHCRSEISWAPSTDTHLGILR